MKLPDVSDFEKKIGVKFSDKSLLVQALTHRSYINENRRFGLDHNERLEFLGDAVLELAVTEYLYAEYPDKPEGDLTAYRASLVNTITLSNTGVELGINDHLLLSRGEAKDTGRARQYILANAFEAVVGAIYLDQGYAKAKDFIGRSLFHKLAEIIEKSLYQDAKSRFQELAQEKASITPSYETVEAVGPDHDKKFTVGVFLKDEMVAQGEGKSKQDAEQMAAQNALEAKGWS
jgi:ribonuclease-3